jgi:non-specific serine/threonine protein kinase
MSIAGKTIDGISFGPFVLDTKGRRLIRDGRRVPVTPIELKLLETLLRHRGSVLTGDDLRLLVWADDPSTGVAPAQDTNALYVAIRKLRRSLGDEGSWVVNIPKVGYTFTDDVAVEGGDADGRRDAGETSSFIGRAKELARLKQLLKNSRLVTLTGPPGIGKSRLAFEFAAAEAGDFPDGTYLVNLVPIESESLVAGAVLGALGVAENPDRTEVESVIDHLKKKQALIVLDNCEHLIEACSDLVDRLIRAVPKVRVIATSFEPLMLAGEAIMPVPPLGVQGADGAAASNGPGSSDAVELFIRLAEQHRSDLPFGEDELQAVGDLCRKLEGLPLAIELAAVQIGAYTVEQIIEAMADRFRLLRRRGGENDRHKTLEGAVDWSFSLLSEEERSSIQRLSVFTGGWTVDGARAVCCDEGIAESEILHLSARLVRRSLVQVNSGGGAQRYSMLETIRHFARRCLRESGEEEKFLDRRDRYLLELSEKAFEAGGDTEWLERSRDEYDNIRLALDRSIRRGRSVETGLRLCGALPKFWFNYGHFREAKFWTKLALDADDGESKDASARALRTAGFFFGQFAGAGEDPEIGKAYFEKSLALWRELDADREEAFTLVHYSFLLYRLGQIEEAKAASQKSLDISSELGDQANIARAANNLALAYLEMGKTAEAGSLLDVALSAARLANDLFLEALCLYYLGETALRSGEVESARHTLVRSYDLFTSIGNRPHAARSLLLRGEAAALLKDYAGALKLEQSALREFHEIDDNQGIASSLEAIACTRAMEGSQLAHFLTLTAAASEIRRQSKLKMITRRKGM